MCVQRVRTGLSEDFVAWTNTVCQQLLNLLQMQAMQTSAKPNEPNHFFAGTGQCGHAYLADLNGDKKKFHQMPANTGGTVCCAVRGGQACQETS